MVHPAAAAATTGATATAGAHVTTGANATAGSSSTSSRGNFFIFYLKSFRSKFFFSFIRKRASKPGCSSYSSSN